MSLIEKLKHNERPFGLNSKEERECFREAGKNSCQSYSEQGWVLAGDTPFYDSSTYRIKPDYQPEPEPQVERCEVSPTDLCYMRTKQFGFKQLYEALSDPDFMCFEYENGNQCTSPRNGYAGVDKPAPIPKWVLFVRPE